MAEPEPIALLEEAYLIDRMSGVPSAHRDKRFGASNFSWGAAVPSIPETLAQYRKRRLLRGFPSRATTGPFFGENAIVGCEPLPSKVRRNVQVLRSREVATPTLKVPRSIQW